MTDTYVYLIREQDWDSDAFLAGAQRTGEDDTFAQHGAFAEAAARLGARIVQGAALQNARHGGVVTPGDGERAVEDAVWTDSPYADSSELITGFYEIEVADEEMARHVAALVPTGSTVEWRKVFPTG